MIEQDIKGISWDYLGLLLRLRNVRIAERLTYTRDMFTGNFATYSAAGMVELLKKGEFS